ncbi:MAG TPA: 5-formyltetrahydrofolate cyclo-ligase [Jatrophihabitans sp.]
MDGVGHPNDEDHAEGKAALRADFTSARRTRSAESIEQARTAIRAVLLDRWRQALPNRVAAYVPLRTEPGSVELLDDLVALGTTVLVPVLLDDLDLDWRLWGSEDATPTLTPSAIATVDVALVPALAVAEDGTRLGRGGGSYDRALARLPQGRDVIALLYEDELVSVLPRDAWDRPVTVVVTPSGWRTLTRLDGE